MKSKIVIVNRYFEEKSRKTFIEWIDINKSGFFKPALELALKNYNDCMHSAPLTYIANEVQFGPYLYVEGYSLVFTSGNKIEFEREEFYNLRMKESFELKQEWESLKKSSPVENALGYIGVFM
jgi:hypothetical protein